MVCNAVDPEWYEDGTGSCGNCGVPLTPPDPGRKPVLYPVLTWYWSPCQQCGSGANMQQWPEAHTCWECGADLSPMKVRACAEGFPAESQMFNSERPKTARVGDQGVWTGAGSVQLLGADPFTLLEVIAIRPNGDLDLARVADGTHWMAVPTDSFEPLYRPSRTQSPSPATIGTHPGPSPVLQMLFAKAQAAPLLVALPGGEQHALNERVIAAREFEDLDRADQALISRGILQTNAGMAGANYGDFDADWAAEDAVRDRVEDASDADGDDLEDEIAIATVLEVELPRVRARFGLTPRPGPSLERP